MSKPSARHGWNESNILDQRGRTAVITGANSGIGFATALALARKGARVVLACRNPLRAEAARTELLRLGTNPAIETVELSLADLDSVRAAAETLLRRHERIDLLINNAGAMVPQLELSAESLDQHMAVNYLGHFAWTGLLLPRLLSTPGSRVVNLGSLAHWLARHLPPDLTWKTGQRYASFQTYAQSKLAVLLFTRALNRRLAHARAPTITTAAHPGGSRTELLRSKVAGMPPWLSRHVLQFQSPAQGALPVLRAALDDNARGGDYFGPAGVLQLSGRPERVAASRLTQNLALQEALWRASLDLTRIEFPV